MVKLSIIIPAYDEEERIEDTLNSYISFFNKNYKGGYEIIVIPNNCKDKTFEITSRIAKKNKQIKIKNIPYFVGKSGAVIEGFKLARGDLIGMTDADNSGPPESFFKLVKEIGDYDGAIGSRWVPGAEIELRQPLARRIASRSFNFLVRLLLGLKYYDTQCGSKIFKKEPIQKIINSLGNTQWAFDIDLLYRLKKINSKIKEVPIRWKDDPGTRLNLKKAPAQMFLALLRLRLVHSPLNFVVEFYDFLFYEMIHKKRFTK